MKPRLYAENETSFEGNGLGPLSDALACTVEENRNGAFELSMEYPVTGVLFDELKHGSIIFAQPNDTSDPQPFRVYAKSTPLSGIVSVRAKHISYQLSHIPVAPFTAGSCTAALQGLKTNAAEPCPFDFWTDKETTATFTVEAPASARSLLGGVAGSVLDVYGGEYEFDRYTVKLHKARGRDSGVVIAYGKNLVDLDQEDSIENTVTGVYPYYKDADGNVLELPEKVISSASAQNFPYPRTVPLDCSQVWQETPSVEQLREYAESYVKRESIGVPSVSLKVSFIPLWQTEEYKAVAPAERLCLCDTATVRFEKLGVNAKAKVVQTVYDVLAGRYESITLGEASTNLADTIADQDKAISEKPDSSDLAAAAANATAWITGNKGGYVVLRRNADGQPYELLIMDKPTIEEATKVWRFNNSGLGYSSTGYNGTYGLAMTQDGQIVADFITSGTLSANLLRAGVLQDKTGKAFKLDLDAGTLEANFSKLQISSKTVEEIAGEKADEAKTAAANDLKEYQAEVAKTVKDLQGQIDGNITTWFYPYEPTAENEPASTWETEGDREAHAGDLFYNTDPGSGKAYRWALVDDSWQWLLLEDTDVAKALANAKNAQDTADGKRRTFITTPTPPYDVGDLWTDGEDLLVCVKGKAEGQAYAAADWEKRTAYTTKTETESLIKQEANSIEISVKKSVTEETDKKLEGYSTKTETESSINVALEGIKLGIRETDVWTDGSFGDNTWQNFVQANVSNDVLTITAVKGRYCGASLYVPDTLKALLPGRKVRVTYEYKVTQELSGATCGFIRWIYYANETSDGYYGGSTWANSTKTAAVSDWKTVTFTFTVKSDTITRMYFQPRLDSGATGQVQVRNVSLQYVSGTDNSFQLTKDGVTISSAVLNTSGYASRQDLTTLQLNYDSLQASVIKDGEVRSKFAMDTSSVTISSGVITFSGNTLVVNSDNFKLAADGTVAITGTFTSQVGTSQAYIGDGEIKMSIKDSTGNWRNTVRLWSSGTTAAMGHLTLYGNNTDGRKEERVELQAENGGGRIYVYNSGGKAILSVYPQSDGTGKLEMSGANADTGTIAAPRIETKYGLYVNGYLFHPEKVNYKNGGGTSVEQWFLAIRNDEAHP